MQAWAGGGGMLQEDRCVIEMGFLSAHLTLYQPQTRASERFCETVPDLTETVIVLEYLHDSLNEVPIELRIIADATKLGGFARWEDVQALGNIEPLTVFHQPAVTRPGGTYEVEHTFRAEGDYLILVTTRHPSKDNTYHAVAPLVVGGTSWGYWLILPAGLLLGGMVAMRLWKR